MSKNSSYYLVFFQLFFVGYLSAQRSSFGYLLDATGFNCSESKGEICFVTNFDLIGNPFACDGAVVEIEYPTGSFMPTTLGEFVVHNSNATVTVLRYVTEILTVTSDQITCFEGELLIPETMFNVRILSPDDLTEVIEVSSFLVDDLVEVGEPDETTLLSDLILPGGDLLPVADAAFNGQRILVAGKLIVDVDYFFGQGANGGGLNNITFLPDASIETQEGQSIELEFLRSNLQGCPGEGRWEGVIINDGGSIVRLDRSSIDGAKIGVNMRDDASLRLVYSSLSNHQRGISSIGSIPRTINIFTPPNIPARPTIFNCDYGMELENVEAPFLEYINFKKNETGLRLTNLNTFFARHLLFEDNETGISGGENLEAFSLYNSDLLGGFTGIDLRFYSSFSLIDNDIEDCNTAVRLLDNRINSRGIIVDNFIRSAYNIFAVHRPGTMFVSGNDMGADAYNFAIFGNFGGNHRWVIRDNPVLFAGLNAPAFGNTVLMGTEKVVIADNSSMIADDGPSIVLSGGSNSTIENNNLFAGKEGIIMNGSSMNTISCNIVDGDVGMEVLNNCSGADIKGNDFSYSGQQNLNYGNDDNTMAISSVQEYKGNIFANSSPNSPVAEHFGSDFEVDFSLYKVNQNNVQGGTLFPYFVSNADYWFEGTGNNEDYDCPEGVIAPSPDNEKLMKASVTEFLSVPFLNEFYGSDVASVVELQGARHRLSLEEEQISLAGLINSEITNPMSNYAGIFNEWLTEIGDPGQIPSRALDVLNAENSFRDIIQLSTTEELELIDNAVDLRTLETMLSSSEPVLDVSEAGEVMFNLENYQERQGFLSDLVSTHAQADDLFSEQALILQNAIPALELYNGNVDPEGLLPYEVKKEVNAIALKQLADNSYTLSSQEVSDLELYANLCAAKGGDGVYLARAILTQYLGVANFDYKDECLPKEEEKDISIGAPTHLVLQANIFPNPTNSESIVRLPNNHNFETLLVVDVNGRKMLSRSLDNEVFEVGINQDWWLPGTYFVSLLREDEIVHLKLIIQ
ncbi:MAG: NosD domain-containing protein [Lewinella sp.]|uniref:NosD domain-containing protein n=1 Tax=Lewinella sp. TaxID=2004506 RepID=UPI003D6B8FF6